MARPVKRKNAYEVPKGSGTLVYIGALGGMDVNNQLKIAALRYRIEMTSGQDLFLLTQVWITNGKLDYGQAEIDADDCSKWDQFFITKRSEVDFLMLGTNVLMIKLDADFEYPNYQIPESILEWEMLYGNLPKIKILFSPYYERPEGNIGYDPINDGDYPWYDLTGQIDCRTSRRVTLYGDYNMWWIFNDKGNIHTETGEIL